MSIDALIQAHIEALNTNTKAVELLTLSLAGRTPKAEDKPVKSKTAVEEKNAADPVLPNGEKMVEPGNPNPVAEESTAVPYETVRALVLKLAATKRAEIPVVFAKYDIKNLKGLLDKEDDFSTVNDQVKLEAVYADLQALEG